MNKKKYVKPILEAEEFVPQEYIAACEYIQVLTGSTGVVLAPLIPPGNRTGRVVGTNQVYTQWCTVYQIGTANTTEKMPLPSVKYPAILTDDPGGSQIQPENNDTTFFMDAGDVLEPNGFTDSPLTKGSSSLFNVCHFWKKAETSQEKNAS